MYRATIKYVTKVPQRDAFLVVVHFIDGDWKEMAHRVARGDSRVVLFVDSQLFATARIGGYSQGRPDFSRVKDWAERERGWTLTLRDVTASEIPVDAVLVAATDESQERAPVSASPGS